MGLTNHYRSKCWPWFHHQMETFSALLAFCVVNSPVTSEFLAQSPVTQSFDVFFDLRLSKQLSKQSWGWRFEMPLSSLWHHCNDPDRCHHMMSVTSPQCVIHCRVQSVFRKHENVLHFFSCSTQRRTSNSWKWTHVYYIVNTVVADNLVM